LFYIKNLTGHYGCVMEFVIYKNVKVHCVMEVLEFKKMWQANVFVSWIM